MTRHTARTAGLGIGLFALLGACDVTTGGGGDQVSAMSFEQCQARIDETAARIGQDPAVLVETSDQQMVRFDDAGETVTVTCDRMLGQMIVQTRPAPAAAGF